MPSPTLSNLIRDIDINSFHARYLRTPTIDRPVGCQLPAAIQSSQQYPEVTVPDIQKDCSYSFIEETLPIEPFIPDFPCPNGFEYVQKTVGIRPLPGLATVASFDISLTRGNDQAGAVDICRYIFDMPDLTIPCYPSGPTIESTASITVQRGAAQTVTRFGVTRDPAVPCRWVIDGNVDIDIPVLPCPDGVAFLGGGWKINSTCSTVKEETKRVKITKEPGYDCLYQVVMPDLTIPCYPAGPSVYGNSLVTVTDRGTTVSTQKLGFPAVQPSCCDFPFSGDLTIEIPCQTGLTVPAASFTINSTGPSVQAPTVKQVTLTKSGGDMCVYDLIFPNLDIPCYPAGPQVTGDVSVHVGVGGTALPVQHITIGADPQATCQFGLAGDIYIPLPDYTLNCSALNFHGGIRVKHSRTTAWLNHTVALANEACGAVLDGDINLGLPAFVECTALQFGGGIAVRPVVNGTPGTPFPSTVTLQPTACGADLVGDILLDIPAFNFPCPAGYTFPSGQHPTVTMNGAAVNNTLRVEKYTDSAYHPNGSQCGVRLGGTLALTTGGGSGLGFNYLGDWVSAREFAPFDVVGQLGHEGGRCTYVAAQTVPVTIGPPSSNPAHWTGMGCDDGKRYKPFKVIQAVGNTEDNDASSKSWAKVIFDSKLNNGKALRTIRGLDCPMLMRPGESIYLHVFWDLTTAEPKFITAGVAHSVDNGDGYGDIWDRKWDFGSGIEQPLAGDDELKFLAPTALGANFNSARVWEYLYREFGRWACISNGIGTPLSASTLTLLQTADLPLYNEIVAVYNSIEGMFKDNKRGYNVGRPFCTYHLIAKAKAVADQGDESSSDVILQYNDNKFGIQQVLDTHLYELGVVKGTLSHIKLVKGSPSDEGSLTLTITPSADAAPGPVGFSVTIQQSSYNSGVTPPVIGSKSDDIQVYFTAATRNGPLTEPTYNDYRDANVWHYGRTPVAHDTNILNSVDPEFSIRAIAYHPRYRCSKVVSRNFSARTV